MLAQYSTNPDTGMVHLVSKAQAHRALARTLCDRPDSGADRGGWTRSGAAATCSQCQAAMKDHA